MLQNSSLPSYLLSNKNPKSQLLYLPQNPIHQTNENLAIQQRPWNGPQTTAGRAKVRSRMECLARNILTSLSKRTPGGGGGGALSLGPVLAVGHLPVPVGLSSFVVRECKWGDHGAARPTPGPASHPREGTDSSGPWKQAALPALGNCLCILPQVDEEAALMSQLRNY